MWDLINKPCEGWLTIFLGATTNETVGLMERNGQLEMNCFSSFFYVTKFRALLHGNLGQFLELLNPRLSSH